MLVDLRPKKATGKAAEKVLDRAGITFNKNGIPFDPEKPTITSGVRLGTPAGTTRGFGVAEFRQVGDLIADVLDGIAKNGPDGDAQVEAQVRGKVRGALRPLSDLPRLTMRQRENRGTEMRCPFCGHEDTQVKDSRPTDDNAAIRRRRYCPSCGSRFTTFERVQLRELTVVKKNGQRVPFDRDKLARSISCLRKRPVDPERVERVVNGIVRRLESSARARSPRRRSARW